MPISTGIFLTDSCLEKPFISSEQEQTEVFFFIMELGQLSANNTMFTCPIKQN